MPDRSRKASARPDRANLDEQPRENYRRWQERRIQHMGFTTNLILTLALAEIGIVSTSFFSLAKGIQAVLLVITLAVAGVSALFGVLLVLNRLQDFRTMTRLNRVMWEEDRAQVGLPPLREKSSSTLSADIAELNTRQLALGRKTWWLFNVQLWLWLASAVALSAFVLVRQMAPE